MQHQTTRKLAAITLIFTFFLSALPQTILAAQDLNGFTLLATDHSVDFDADLYYYEHTQSGGHVLYIDNADEEKFFGIGFRTPPEDNMGVPHIFEHAVLQGSKNYPVKGLFSVLAQTTMNTFLNAMTYNDFTVYPIASRNEKDFQNLMKIYLDAVFFPNVLQDEFIFKQEGIRLEADEEGNLSYTGVVYSEMESHMADASQLIYYSLMETLMPDTAYQYNSGGNPADVENLTYEHLIQVHNKYYTPENALIIVYGDQNISSTMEIIGTYLDQFAAKGFVAEIEHQPPISETVYRTIAVPSDGTNKQSLAVGYLLPEMGEENHIAANVLTTILMNGDSAPLMKRLYASGIAESYDILMDSNMPRKGLAFYANNADPERAGEFEKVLNDAILEIIQEGFTAEYLDSVYSAYEFSLAMSKNSNNMGLSAIITAVMGWLYYDDPAYDLNQTDVLQMIKEKGDSAYFTSLLTKLISENSHKAVITGRPDPNYSLNRQNEVAEKLAGIKAEMTEEELKALQASTTAFYNWQARPVSQGQMATLPVLSLDDLADDALGISYTVENFNGLKLIHTDVNTNGIGYVNMYFDGNTVKQEDLHFAALAAMLLGSLNTGTASAYDMALYQNNLINGFGAAITPMQQGDNLDSYKPYINVSFLTLDQNVPEALALTREIIRDTRYDDKELVQQVIVNYINYLDTYSEYLDLNNYILGSTGQMGLFYQYINGAAFKEFLAEVYFAMEENFEEISQKLTQTRNAMFSKNNLVIEFTGAREDYEAFRASAIQFAEGINNLKVTPQEYYFEPNPDKVAVTYPSQRLNVAQAANYVDEGIDFDGSFMVVSNLVSMNYLWPIIREQNGAYGITASISPNGYVMVYSNSDPNLVETLAVYETIPEYLENFAMTQEELNSIIISTVSNFDSSYTGTSLWGIGGTFYLSGSDMETVNATRTQIVDTTVSDIINAAQLFHIMNEQGKYIVIGAELLIGEHADLFDAIY